jgi:hypothetical protein
MRYATFITTVEQSRDARPMSLTELREGVSHDDALVHARAVFAAMREVVSGKEPGGAAVA